MSERPGGGLRQELEQRQGLVMTPAINQSLHMLAMPILELSEYAAGQMEENPLLEVAEDVQGDYPGGSYRPENSSYRPEPAASGDEDFRSMLRLQLATRKAEPDLSRSALYIIEHLDEDGYLSLPLPGSMEDALSLVQSLEPPGVAARNLRECLSLQIGVDNPRRELLLAIIEGYLPQLAKNQVREVARALKTTAEQVTEAFAQVRALQPRPAAAFSASAAITPYIVPDIIIREIAGAFVVSLNEALEPRLAISPYYGRLALQTRQDKEASTYLRQKLAAAQALLGSMEKRRQTLLRLAQITADSQGEFLRRGVEKLAPLTMKDVAELAGFHESTVSRAVAGKYVQTSRGVYEWKYFFPRAYATPNGPLTPAWAKQQLAELIAHEDKKSPWSDQQLQEQLAARGLILARRTIAKYREQLRLPPRHLRRQV